MTVEQEVACPDAVSSSNMPTAGCEASLFQSIARFNPHERSSGLIQGDLSKPGLFAGVR
jgi:hypothetical protein